MKKVKLIQSIQRAFDIINCFNEDNVYLKLNDISEILNLNINTTRGIVNTLLCYGYLEHDEIQNVYSLGYIFRQKNNLLKLNDNYIFESETETFLTDLADKYTVTARLHLVKNFDIINLISKDPKASRYIFRVKDSVEFPLNATSSGKLILYYSDEKILENYLEDIPKIKITENTITEKEKLILELDSIKENGYSMEFDEVGIGISSIAVPILSFSKLKYTISVSGPTAIIKENIESLSKEMLEFAKKQRI